MGEVHLDPNLMEQQLIRNTGQSSGATHIARLKHLLSTAGVKRIFSHLRTIKDYFQHSEAVVNV